MSKRTFQPSERKEETNTVSEKECLRQMEEEFWLREELKAERV
jgi:hypothetical protein